LGGWARNLDSGDVEIVARGEGAELDELARWLTVGPPAATVSSVTTETADVETPAVFEVR
jgi:acylphosphatase